MFAKLNRARRNRKLRAAGAKIGQGLQSFEDFFGGTAKGFVCGPGLYLSSGCKIYVVDHGGRPGQLTIGRSVYVNHYTIIDCHYSISIGNAVLIGPYCYICDYDHGTNADRAVASQPEGETGAVRIADGVWLGAGVIVLKGVTIGEGAIVGAGSVVTRDVLPSAIVAGNPAHLVRMR
jgi:acetyltransferase-like isoleucine patch superfamily enzyme